MLGVTVRLTKDGFLCWVTGVLLHTLHFLCNSDDYMRVDVILKVSIRRSCDEHLCAFVNSQD